MVSKSPVWLLGLPPVMEAEHDGEGAGGQQLLVVVVVQAVGRCQGKSVANLFDNGGHDNKSESVLQWLVITYQHSTTLGVDVVSFNVLITKKRSNPGVGIDLKKEF